MQTLGRDVTIMAGDKRPISVKIALILCFAVIAIAFGFGHVSAPDDSTAMPFGRAVMFPDFGRSGGRGNQGSTETAAMTYDGEPVQLSNDDVLIITRETAQSGRTDVVFSITPRQNELDYFDITDYGFVEYGYVQNDEFVRLGSGIISDGEVFSLENEDLHGGGLYIRSFDIDSIYINSISITSL